MRIIALPIAFYKGKGTIADKLVRIWTKSAVSHSEIGRSDGLFHSNDRFNRVSRLTNLDYNSQDWEFRFVTLPIEVVKKMELRQNRKLGTLYDWKGIFLSHVFKLGAHQPKKWFCSKSNCDDLVFALKYMKKRVHGGKYERFASDLSVFEGVTPSSVSPREFYDMVHKVESSQIVLTRQTGKVRLP